MCPPVSPESVAEEVIETEEAAESVTERVAEKVIEGEDTPDSAEKQADVEEDEEKDETFVLSDDEFEQLQSRDQFVTMTRRKKRMKIGRERRRYDLFCDDDYVVHVKKNH